MKTANRTLLIFLTFALFIPAQAQYMGASVGYMKVKPGQWNNYLQLEKDAKEFHQARVEKGIITQWHLYEKMYTGTDDPYEFIVVSFFDDYNKSEGGATWKLATEMYTEEERAGFWKRIWETRDMVKEEYYDQVAASETFKPAKYLRVNQYKVKQGDAGRYIESRREITQPLFSELVEGGHMAGWSLWRKLTYDKEFQFVSVDAFEEFGQWKSGIPYEETWKKVHPDKEQSEVLPEYRNLRMSVRSEYWKLVEFTVPKQEE
jgi:hypothetical protein